MWTRLKSFVPQCKKRQRTRGQDVMLYVETRCIQCGKPENVFLSGVKNKNIFVITKRGQRNEIRFG